eukprot:344807-Hanusia_phi.AAC.3
MGDHSLWRRSERDPFRVEAGLLRSHRKRDHHLRPEGDRGWIQQTPTSFWYNSTASDQATCQAAAGLSECRRRWCDVEDGIGRWVQSAMKCQVRDPNAVCFSTSTPVCRFDTMTTVV